MENIILDAITILHKEFSAHPYDFVSMEIEAQVKLYMELSKQITSTMIISVNDTVPPIIDKPCSRVRMEWGFDGYKNDIIVFKENIYKPLPQSYDDVDTAIELKIGWGCTKDHLEHKLVLKDFEFIRKYPTIGYLIIYLANEYAMMDSKWKDYYYTQFKINCQNYNFLKGHAFLIFTDEIFVN